jgi:hypothetical protein
MSDLRAPARPMSRLSRESEAPASGRFLRLLLILALLAGLSWAGFEAAAHAYRQTHCVLLFGHWVSVDPSGRTIPLFCQ